MSEQTLGQALDSTPSGACPVAVVGAGLAGLACAQALQQAGVVVQVFDKSRGPSGRMSTRRGDGWQCDHGAQYFTARAPAFRAEVQAWVAAGVADLWQPRFQVFGPARLANEGQASAPGGTRVAEAPERWVGVPRMTSPAGHLVQQLERHQAGSVHLQHTVQALWPQGDGRWRLCTQEHGELPQAFDAVLLAVPSVQAVPLLQAVHAPWAARAAQARMRGSWALMVQTAQPLGLPFDAAFVNEGPLRWVACDSSKPGRPQPGGEGQCWLLHSEAEWAEAHIEDEPETVAHALWQAFGDVLAAQGLARPAALDSVGLAHSIHRWRYADTAPPLGQQDAWCGATRLGLCGDWLGSGKVEGAWLSGRALAAQVLGTVSAQA
jgi:predicted NAD/FAD-dependent oxidoreductase